MKKTILILFINLLAYLPGTSQTNVSGGIFSNTTWTLSNSPYIVTANVVVFPGVTLTIQPGVIVKFTIGTNLEIRQSTLIANGTAADKIVFTSNNPSPYRGIWDQIYVNQSVNIQMKHCEFHFANKALTGQGNNVSVVNSTFTQNILGMDAQSNTNIRVDSCVFKNNDTGQSLQPGYSMSITNCHYIRNDTGLYAQTGCSVIRCVIDSNNVYGLLKHMSCDDTIRGNEINYNGTGIVNDFSGCGGTVYIHHNEIENNNIGILFHNSGGSQQFNIYNNSICSNNTYNIQNLTALSVNAVNNCWCSTNLSYIQTKIYDAYDDVSSGIVSFNPIDTSAQCISGLHAGIVENRLRTYSLYPDPFSEFATLEFESLKNEKVSLLIYNSLGELVRVTDITGMSRIQIERAELRTGLYLIQLRSDKGIITNGKFIITN